MGDVLIHCGDLTMKGSRSELERFGEWFSALPHPQKLFIAGNHDFILERDAAAAALVPSAIYLQDSETEIAGVRFYGSPWVPRYRGWAFNVPREQLAEKWARIPSNIDVLVTHAPPHGMQDVSKGVHLGCEALSQRVEATRPKLHVFGHIHESYGICSSEYTTFINASICSNRYRAMHRPIEITIGPGLEIVL